MLTCAMSCRLPWLAAASLAVFGVSGSVLGGVASAAPSAPPGGSSTTSSSSYVDTGAYTLSSGVRSVRGKTVTATGSDESGVLVKGGSLTLRRARITTSGSSKSSDSSSFCGLDAGVLAENAGQVTLLDGTVSTSGAGANDVFAYGSSAKATLAGETLRATGQYAHGAMASGGGTLVLDGVTISTAGGSSAAVATDRDGGSVTVNGGTMTTSGGNSPGIYSTGKITATGARMVAAGAEAAVVEGANSITVNHSRMTGSVNRGVMLYQSMSGDASAGTGSYTMRGGSLTAKAGPAFYVTNETARINLSGEAKISARSGVLLRSDSAGTGSGNTGAGVTTLTARHETLTGDLVAAGTGSIDANLRSASTLTGTITDATLSLDAESRWTVAGTSTLTGLSGITLKAGKVTNIIGDGHTVTYKPSASSALGGKTYKLTGGGTLKPA